jgi:hypothetical protein
MRDAEPIPDTPSIDISRLAAAKHLTSRHHMRGSFGIMPQTKVRNSLLAGVQAALALIIALPLFALSSYSHLIGFAALGSLCALFGRYAPKAQRVRILAECCAVQTGAVILMSAIGWAGASEALKLSALALCCGLFYWIALARAFGPPGPLIFIFAAGAAMHTPDSLDDIAARGLATGGVALLALILCAISEAIRHAEPEQLPPAPLLDQNAIQRGAIKSIVAAAISIFAANGLGAEHPMWAAMATMAVLQAPRLNHALHRVVQRSAGTMVGTMLIWMLLSMEPNIWVIFAVLALLQIATEVVIGANYGLGQIFVTPMALLMTFIAAQPSDANAMIVERIWDTLLGAVIGLLIALIWSSVQERSGLSPEVRLS